MINLSDYEENMEGQINLFEDINDDENLKSVDLENIVDAIDKKSAEEEIKKLRKQIEYYNKMYYEEKMIFYKLLYEDKSWIELFRIIWKHF